MPEAFSFDWQLAGGNLLRMSLAFVLAFPLAWERVKSERSVGLRTFPIVAVASCGYMLIALHLPGTSPETTMRGLQGLLAGIGFIGGGAILKSGGSVRGLATAASLWSTGGIGAAVAFRREEIAVVLAIANFALLRWLKPLKKDAEEE